MGYIFKMVKLNINLNNNNMDILKKIVDTFENVFQSKKFWYAFAMFLFIPCSSSFGISEGEMANLIWVGTALIIAQGIADRKCYSK